ncbi:MAG TPA: hypothetical protein VGJ28_21640 [Micromonosporaceae bacterium]|jgi:membrane protein implicated in regulation of membrane protease activity
MVHDESAIGATGVLLVATQGVDGPGEILIKIRGGTETYLAWSDEPLPRGTTVLVVQAHGARRVTVVPWAEPSIQSEFPDMSS